MGKEKFSVKKKIYKNTFSNIVVLYRRKKRMEEELIEAFDNFVIGNFQAVLDLAQARDGKRGSSEFSQVMWASICARCHLALGHMDKVREFAKSSSAALAATAYFAVFQRSQEDPQRKAAALEKIITAANQSNGEPVSCYYACVARAMAGDVMDAINYGKAVSASSPAEFNALRAQFCLMINRIDLASKTLAEAAANRDDSAAAKLVTAMHLIVSGRPNEACMSYSDLIAQFNAAEIKTALPLANGRAVGNIQRGMFSEAAEDLEETADENADSLRNLICCLSWQGKRREALVALDRLGKLDSAHALLHETRRLSQAFAQFA